MDGATGLGRSTAEHVDVLIVGAGISGIGAAHHLQEQCPGRSFLLLDALDGYGGTWRTNRYPGVRSDSDLYTFGYRFKPWTGAPIASGEEIQRYLGWRHTQDYWEERKALPAVDLDGPEFRYRCGRATPRPNSAPGSLAGATSLEPHGAAR